MFQSTQWTEHGSRSPGDPVRPESPAGPFKGAEMCTIIPMVIRHSHRESRPVPVTTLTRRPAILLLPVLRSSPDTEHFVRSPFLMHCCLPSQQCIAPSAGSLLPCKILAASIPVQRFFKKCHGPVDTSLDGPRPGSRRSSGPKRLPARRAARPRPESSPGVAAAPHPLACRINRCPVPGGTENGHSPPTIAPADPHGLPVWEPRRWRTPQSRGQGRRRMPESRAADRSGRCLLTRT